MQLIATLTDDQIARLQDRTAELLATTGLKITHQELLRLCRAAGAQVDADAGIVRFLRREREFFAHELLDYSGGPEATPSLLERAHARVEELTRDGASPHPPAVQEALRKYFADQYRSSTKP